ncbi:hypothetical protein CRG98_050078, partial [Punica granatum]
TELDLSRTFRVKEDVAYEPADLMLERSLEALSRKRDELHNVFETVKQRVEKKEGLHLVRTPEVGGWLERVQLLLEKEVRKILEQGAQEMEKGFQGVGGDSLSQSQRNSTSYYQLSKHAEEKRATLEEELRNARSFAVFTYKPDDPLLVEIPLEPPVGLESSFEENDYDIVAWVVVSQPTDPRKIQGAIWEKLHLLRSEFDRKSELDRASKILNIMKRKSFLLFLDDVWEEIDLLNLGIPSPDHQHKSKIIFTTRSGEVCDLMRAERTKKIDCLPPDKALKLFREKVLKRTLGCRVYGFAVTYNPEAIIEENWRR